MNMRVLVADDDPEMLELVANIAKRNLGAEVTRVATGHELLDAIAHGAFDLVITDISMPWMTGLQVMHSARTAGLPVPVVVMTGMENPELSEQVDALGTRARLLHKPFTLQELLAAVGEIAHAA
ncbi:MAG TPA: response regulator [Kofleriaceae bacterium]|jgi:CheY-like chemotaxis protein|nr:response regulator [Kofleriaceae bacterium]